MTKVVVFGGSGFLGSYVVDELTQQGYQVINADCAPPQYSFNQHQHTSVDILNAEQVRSIITGDVDIVFNYAGLADLDIAKQHPCQTMQLNIMGNLNILEACRHAKVKRIMFASSAYACSDQGSFYGISKLSSEKIIEEYQKQYNLNFTILRYGSLYGERADKHNGIYRVLLQALKDKKINYYGTGEEVREYIHCRDAAKLSVQALNSEFRNQHIILTGTEKLKYKDVLVMINEMLGNTVEINIIQDETKSHYKVTPYSFTPRVAKKLISNPHIDLGQGLLECMEYLHKALYEEKENA